MINNQMEVDHIDLRDQNNQKILQKLLKRRRKNKKDNKN